MTQYLKVLFLAACLLWPHAAMADKKSPYDIAQEQVPRAIELAAKSPIKIADAETLRTTFAPRSAMSPEYKAAYDKRFLEADPLAGVTSSGIMAAQVRTLETPFRTKNYYSFPNDIELPELVAIEEAAAANGAIPVQAYLFYVYDAGRMNSQAVGGFIQQLFAANPKSRFGGSSQGVEVTHVYIDTNRPRKGVPFLGIGVEGYVEGSYEHPIIPGTAILVVGAVKDPLLFDRTAKLKAAYQSDQRNFILEHAVTLDRYIKALRAGKLDPPPGSAAYDEICQAGRTQVALFYSYDLYDGQPAFYAGLNRQNLTKFAPNGRTSKYWKYSGSETQWALINDVRDRSAEIYTEDSLCRREKLDWYKYSPNWLVLARAIDSVKHTLAKK
ncbi:MAG: hypothetical protein AAF650_10025 [Pseudomonadota bacterium]